MLSRAHDPTPLHDDLWVPLEANFPALPVGALPSDPPASVDRYFWALSLGFLYYFRH